MTAKATQEQLEYLDGLRESGETNMFGAGGYVVGRFGVTRNEAREIVQHWMDTFEDRQVVRELPEL